MTKWTVVISMLALSAGACDADSSKDKPKPDGGLDSGLGIPDGGSDIRYPECSEDDAREEVGLVGAKWNKPAPWSPADVSACEVVCPDQEFSCIEDNCKGGKDFVDCYIGEIAYCGGDAEDAECPEDYRIFGCCLIDALCFESTTQDQFDACLQDRCLTDFQEFFRCAQSRCQQSAVVTCAGGTSTAPDAGTNKSGYLGHKSLLQRMGGIWAKRYGELKSLQK